MWSDCAHNYIDIHMYIILKLNLRWSLSENVAKCSCKKIRFRAFYAVSLLCWLFSPHLSITRQCSQRTRQNHFKNTEHFHAELFLICCFFRRVLLVRSSVSSSIFILLCFCYYLLLSSVLLCFFRYHLLLSRVLFSFQLSS